MICVRVASDRFPPQPQLCADGDKGHWEDERLFGQPGLVSRESKGFQSMCFGTEEYLAWVSSSSSSSIGG